MVARVAGWFRPQVKRYIHRSFRIAPHGALLLESVLRSNFCGERLQLDASVPNHEGVACKLIRIVRSLRGPGEVYVVSFDKSLLRRYGCAWFCELAEQFLKYGSYGAVPADRSFRREKQGVGSVIR